MNGDCECNITITTEAIPQVTVKEEVIQVVEVSTGIPGIDGVGVPVGGNTGDYLQKKTNTDLILSGSQRLLYRSQRTVF